MTLELIICLLAALAAGKAAVAWADRVAPAIRLKEEDQAVREDERVRFMRREP